MSKLRQRQRRRSRRPVPPSQGSRPVPNADLGGWSSAEVHRLGGLLAQDLRHAASTARARAAGGSAPESVTGHFLAPLKYVYHCMDAVSTVVKAQPKTALSPACTPGCCACCRLYVEVGPWEAFGIADFLTRAHDVGALSREELLARLREEVTRFVDSGGDKGQARLCAFLTPHGTCGVYPARPAACRSYYSRSREACERYFGQPVLQDSGARRVVRTPEQGFTAQLTLAEFLATPEGPVPQDTPPPMYEMQSAVLRILETPNALVRYLHGEDIFQGCARHTPEPELRKARENLLQLQVPALAKQFRPERN
jgi:Fe-S-cluster containining protein